jgi:biotin synthase
MVAVARIAQPETNIAATTALQAMDEKGREIALVSGANVVMPILTPTKYREEYQLYEGKPCIDDTADECRACLESRVASVSKRLAFSERGDPNAHGLKWLARGVEVPNAEFDPL